MGIGKKKKRKAGFSVKDGKTTRKAKPTHPKNLPNKNLKFVHFSKWRGQGAEPLAGCGAEPHDLRLVE